MPAPLPGAKLGVRQTSRCPPEKTKEAVGEGLRLPPRLPVARAGWGSCGLTSPLPPAGPACSLEDVF